MTANARADRFYRFGRDGKLWADELSTLRAGGTAGRVWRKDAALWKRDSTSRKVIENALGWLTVASDMRPRLDEIEQWRREFAGAKTAVLCGMGGSSLAPEVFANTFQQPDRPRLLVLDATSPEQVRRVRAEIDPATTVFLISSKSGSTLETLTQYRYFLHETSRAVGSEKAACARFAAITDPGSPLDQLASRAGFSHVFRNFADIGGRYSALSFFGLVPAALCGADIGRLLDRAEEAMAACRGNDANPGLELGAVLGALTRAGRDKLTIVCSPRIASFGTWLEQLVAESTGKEGRGIVPIEGEPLGTPENYRGDRLFVYERVSGDSNSETDLRLDRIAESGSPVAAFALRDPYDLGARMFTWEFAVAIAGAVIGIDAFDQPNVQESKDNTNAVLADFEKKGSLPAASADWSDGDLEFSGPSLSRFIRSARPGKDYFSIQLYADRSAENQRTAQALRRELRDSTGCATTVGFGPRFLHSTGQLHKGGPDEGVFLQFLAPGEGDVPIPEASYGFRTFLEAQAIGDARALTGRKRRFLACRAAGKSAPALHRLARAVEETKVSR